MIDRMPPHDKDAEESLLSSILIDDDNINEIASRLESSDFYATANGKIYSAMIDLFSNDTPIDLITVAERLRQKNELDGVGGATYLAEIADEAPMAMNSAHYAKIIRGKADLRRIIKAAHRTIDKCYNQHGDTEEIVDFAERTILEATDHKKRDTFVPLNEELARVIDDIDFTGQAKGGLIGLSTGYPSIDALTQGLRRSDLILVAGRPSMGKTALALNISRNVAVESGETVAIFSLEMAGYQLALRFLSTEAKINANSLQNGTLSQSGHVRIGESNQVLETAPIYLSDKRILSLTDMRAMVRRLKKNNGLGLIVVDYLQLMNPPHGMASRVLEVGYLSRNLKAIAGEMDVPVLALSQLNRKLEDRSDKRPILADLRDSGALEQDADIVAFIYRDEVYNKTDAETQGRAEIIISKNRNGQTGTAVLEFIPEYTKFQECWS